MVAYGRLGALTVAVHAWDLLREVTIIFITSTIVWPQVNSWDDAEADTPILWPPDAKN